MSVQAQQSSSSAAVQQMMGWRFVPRCHPAWAIGGHSSGSRQGHPRGVPVIGKIADENGKVDIIINSSCDGKVLAGRPWVARLDQTADTRQTWWRSRFLRTGSQRDGTLGCRSGTRCHRRRTTLSRAEWLGSNCSRHDEETDDECVGLARSVSEA